MSGHISPEEFGDAPWTAFHTVAERREALVAAVTERGWFVEAEEDEGCVTQEELDADFAEAAAEHGLRFNGITWED